MFCGHDLARIFFSFLFSFSHSFISMLKPWLLRSLIAPCILTSLHFIFNLILKNSKLTVHVYFAYRALFVLVESAKNPCAEHHESKSSYDFLKILHSVCTIKRTKSSELKIIGRTVIWVFRTTSEPGVEIFTL